jgi:hypothetical protein
MARKDLPQKTLRQAEMFMVKDWFGMKALNIAFGMLFAASWQRQY